MKKVALVILDGWGHGDHSKSDGIFNADTPFMDELEASAPSAELLTHGEHVGLPEGQMGNSEVGHLNIGAGRIVYQELTRINKSIKDGEFFETSVLREAFEKAKANGKKVHFMGLTSNGGVHSSIGHLKALCKMADDYQIDNCYIHAFTDGRDCNPNSALNQMIDLEEYLTNSSVKIASVIGRYYAMDRDKRWERIKLAYDLLMEGKGTKTTSITEAIKTSYSNDITDEFIKPHIILEEGLIEENDLVICFNFRTDRCREITTVLTQQDMPEHGMKTIKLDYITMTNYDSTFKNIGIVFDKENLKNTLGEVIADEGLSQIRIAETEKYPHVSFFFSGGREDEFDGERRIMVKSPKVATYDLKPEMSAPEITEAICTEMDNNPPHFICLNYANTDMVGHTGVYEAILKAANEVDTCLKQLVEKGKEKGYSFVIIADHGNSDFAINPDGSPNTAHSLNPVPVIVLDEEVKRLKNGTLRDVAPTVLDLMGVSKSTEMTGSSLID